MRSSEPRASNQAGVGALECEHLGNTGRSGQARWHPPMGVHQIGSSGHFAFCREPQLAPESQQKLPSAWAPEPGSKGILIEDRLTQPAGDPHPPYQNAILLGSFRSVLTQRHHAHRDAPTHQRAGERGECGAGIIAWPTGITVGHEHDPHRSIPGVVFFYPRELPGDVPSLLSHTCDHLTEEAKTEEYDPADHHGLHQVEQWPQSDAVPEPEHQRGNRRRENR